MGAAAHPAARHRPKPRCHDAHHRLIAPSACRRTPLPALHRCRPAASNRMPYAVDQAEIALSTAAVAPNSPLRSSIRRRLRRPAHPQRRPPHRQIPIVRQPVTRPPRVPSWEAFGRRPSARADRSPRAGIRNPSPKLSFAVLDLNRSEEWTPASSMLCLLLGRPRSQIGLCAAPRGLGRLLAKTSRLPYQDHSYSSNCGKLDSVGEIQQKPARRMVMVCG